jgi:hypothetical protein
MSKQQLALQAVIMNPSKILTGGANSMQHASRRTTSPRLLTFGSARFRELPKSASFGVGYNANLSLSGVLKNTGSVSYSATELEH